MQLNAIKSNGVVVRGKLKVGSAHERIRYVADTTELDIQPDSIAIAFNTVSVETVSAVLYVALEPVGVEPSAV